MIQTLIDEIPRFFTASNVNFLAAAAGRTLLLSVIGCMIGGAIGFMLVCIRQTRSPWLAPLRVTAIAYTEIFRRIPFLVILFLVLFGIQVIAPTASLFTIALTGVCIVATAFLSEIIRAGFESVPRQQIEAAEVMNFSRMQIIWMVVAPQAWKVILPPAFAFMVMFVKDTALASQIGVVELTFTGKILSNRGFSATLTFGVILLLYFALSYPLTRLGRYLEKRLASPHN
ncbi:amino acid ABC transporter permease [Hoeflea ulvae]|uniref:Amino acid ABC transporter permease n=1 Tax=Hoeflea ulvae TaxID=2983764 RepID=A0ABT3YD31_9HYPH|nr:amino acid ABC transporter permease [Hoeflea ulvae]MCY0093791.1 amino acid ABC transporter permease [Hoeflea ulvae]